MAQPETKRERSTIEFPYLDLDDAIGLAKSMNSVLGSSCQREQLAAHLKVSSTGGGFNMRLGTAKMYGVLTYERGTITLTDLGMHVCDPQQEKQARVDAFLTIPLYRALYEKHKTGTLPPVQGLEAEIVNLGVSSKQKDKARQVFMRSAKQAGFFEFTTDRLVLPVPQKRPEKLATEVGLRKPGEQRDSRQRTVEEMELHPIIKGLVQKIPPAETEWSTEDRAKWLQAAAKIFDLFYLDSDANKGTIKVELLPKGE